VIFARGAFRDGVDGERPLHGRRLTLSTGRRFRLARERAASALLVYLDERSLESERALIDAANELEAVAVRRRLERVSQRGRARQLARVAMLR
jgi:hypothetical protein